MKPNQIRECREAIGLSQAGLAEALQMGPNGADRVRDWERGKRKITGPAAVALQLLFLKEVGEQFAISEALYPDDDA